MISTDTSRIAVKHEKTYVRNTDPKRKELGTGLFSKKKITRGEIIFIAKGTTFSKKNVSKDDSMAYPNAIGITDQKWLEPYATNPLRYINHSCNPNCGIKGAVTFVALKTIKKDDHITIDYSITEGDTGWDLRTQTHMLCKCGEKNCRKVIRSIQFLPKKTYDTYLPYIPTYFKKMYERYNKKVAL